MAAADAARRGATVAIASARLLTDPDQALFRLGLRDVAEISERHVA